MPRWHNHCRKGHDMLNRKKDTIKDEYSDIIVDRKAKKRKKDKKVSLIIMLVIIVLSLLLALTGFITDWLWFKDLGYTDVFWKKYITEIAIGVPVFAVTMLLMRFYLRTLKNGYFRDVESHEIPNIKRLNVISWVLSGVFGLIVGFICMKSTWLDSLKYLNATGFDLKDPLFNIDISFYIFKLEYLTKINNIVILIIVGMVLITLAYYTILLTVRTPDFFKREEEDEEEEEFVESDEQSYVDEEPKEEFNPFEAGSFGKMIAEKIRQAQSQYSGQGRQAGQGAQAGQDGQGGQTGQVHRKHHAPRRTVEINNSNIGRLFSIASGKLIVLGVVFYLMVGVDFFLKQFDLLHVHTGTVYGAGFTDVNVTLWIYRIIIVLSVVGAVTLARHIKKGEIRKLIKVPAIMLGVFVLGTALQVGVQKLIVDPDEINKETKYLENNITFTRHAYGLDNITVSDYSADNSLSAGVLSDNSETIGNIRINDYEPVEKFYNQTQSIRQYYRFNDVDIDRYYLGNVEYQTYLAAREIDEDKISDTWLNKHLKYTHGYGATVSQVNTVTSSGQPDVIVENIPPVSEQEELEITRPEIYFGELTNDYVIVNTKESEFDYPNGSENKYTSYEGEAGVKLGLFNRILYALREGSVNILVSGNITKDSRIIYVRNVIDRVEKIMPYLDYETDPYMTVVDGKLYWIIDAYTTSSYYPYSEPYSDEVGSTNYIRNSIKVVVDAYNGTTDFYVIDKNDPIAVTYQKIYPTLFKDYSEMPEGLQEHVRYPNTLFNIQAKVYTKYHMSNVKVFYQKEDLWDVAHQIYGTEEKEMTASYFIFRLPGEEGTEFMNMIPFTPKSKMNMTALMMARNDGDHYGELVVYTMPKNKTVYGPMQIEAQIDQNTEISKEFSLWSSAGSNYSRGDIFVIPIGSSFLYVEPVYLEASNEAIPEVKRVIVAYGDRIAYEPTLGEALTSLFGGDYSDVTSSESSDSGGSSSSSASLSQKELIEKANEAYQNAVSSQKNGDWKKYGDYLSELEGYLNQLANS